MIKYVVCAELDFSRWCGVGIRRVCSQQGDPNIKISNPSVVDPEGINQPVVDVSGLMDAF